MKVYDAVVFVMITSASLWGQAGPNPAPAPQASQVPMQANMQNPGMRPMDLTAMRIQLSHKLGAELREMQFKVNEMRVDAAKAKDPATKKHLQLEADMWELTITHLNDMTSAMLQVQRPLVNAASGPATYHREYLERSMTHPPAAAAPAAAQAAPVAAQPTPASTAAAQPAAVASQPATAPSQQPAATADRQQ